MGFLPSVLFHHRFPISQTQSSKHNRQIQEQPCPTGTHHKLTIPKWKKKKKNKYQTYKRSNPIRENPKQNEEEEEKEKSFFSSNSTIPS